MDAVERIYLGNMGVVNINGLNAKGNATQSSFSIAEVRARNPSWGRPEPRPNHKYLKSPSIELSKLSGILKGFSTSHESKKERPLRTIIKNYVEDLQSTKHLLCIHHRSTPQFHYDRTVLRITTKLTLLKTSPYPRVLIVVDSEDDAFEVFKGLMAERQHMIGWKPNIINLNDPESEETASPPRVMVASIDETYKFIDRVKNDGHIEELADSLKLIVINNAEKLPLVPHYTGLIKNVENIFGRSWTRIVFMYNFVTAQKSISDVIRLCRENIKKGMYIEVEQPRVRDLFERVDFGLTETAADATNHMAARGIESGNHLSEEAVSSNTILMTAPMQKLQRVRSLIQHYMSERQSKNRHCKLSRRERILIVAKNQANARMVMMWLRQRMSQEDREFHYHVNTILSYDSLEDVEKRNFDFRFGCLDVLVIDWKSIESVIRGTVDSVIMFDSPDPWYFQTVMETEMGNLISRNCVKIKLFIFFNQESDQILFPQYVKFLQKYNKPKPQWFAVLYERFQVNNAIRLAERDLCGAVHIDGTTH